ncbi:hypothetical protein [Oceanimonas marisflavi]|uniref:hypothetical protein n=1 Tax=Oceanimonas marisflavi TaxID=2059724 RepID=UPI000D31D501|nr:hypothetical protein [Oceanimonas marisflavi]
MTELLPARLFAPLALSAVAALALLVWVLKNGDLCPGQRRRIGDGAISVWAVFGLALMLGVEAGVPAMMLWLGVATLVAGLGTVLYQARMQGKRSLDVSWHYPALVLALLYAALVGWRMGPGWALLAAGAGGCVFAHLIMVRAKHRLQAFNVLLPLAGSAFGVIWLLALAVRATAITESAQQSLVMPFVQVSAAVLIGALVWFLPLLRKEPTKPPVIAVAALLILGALTLGQGMIWHMAGNIS